MNTSADPLPPREREVLTLAQSSLSNEAIAEKLGISRDAVRYHLKELHSKLETGSDRNRLLRWGHALLPSGITAAKITVIAAVGLFAAASATVAFTWSDAGDPGSVRAVDGYYPNGCPEHLSASRDMTLVEFADEHSRALGTYDALAEANPELIGVLIPFTADVRVPYNPNGECHEVIEAIPVARRGDLPPTQEPVRLRR